jgi:hypothetical protein
VKSVTARLLRACVVASMVLTSSAVPALGGTESGEVTFRLTLEGAVQSDDGFYIDVRCDGGDFCNGIDKPRYVYFCATRTVADAAICAREDRTFAFTVAIPTQRIEYTLYRVPDVEAPTPELAATAVLSGSLGVHTGANTISLGYVYSHAAPALPDTALPQHP